MLEVQLLQARGLTHKEIAESLGKSERAVRYFLKQMRNNSVIQFKRLFYVFLINVIHFPCKDYLFPVQLMNDYKLSNYQYLLPIDNLRYTNYYFLLLLYY